MKGAVQIQLSLDDKVSVHTAKNLCWHKFSIHEDK